MSLNNLRAHASIVWGRCVSRKIPSLVCWFSIIVDHAPLLCSSSYGISKPPPHLLECHVQFTWSHATQMQEFSFVKSRLRNVMVATTQICVKYKMRLWGKRHIRIDETTRITMAPSDHVGAHNLILYIMQTPGAKHGSAHGAGHMVNILKLPLVDQRWYGSETKITSFSRSHP